MLKDKIVYVIIYFVISEECQQKRHAECTIQIPYRGGPQTLIANANVIPLDLPHFLAKLNR
jgi:hypothetical protein